jgi:choline dehydrogenase-like flavoprotein
MPICPIAAMYNGIVHAEKAEQAGAKLIPQAVVYRVEADNNGRIAAVHYKDPNGNSTRVTGKLFVLAANGIETPKLMLMSTSDKFPRGIGNSSDQVGRNLMDHPGTAVTFLANEPLWPGRGPMEMTSIVNFRDGAFRSDYAAKKLHLSNGVSTLRVTTDLLKKGLTGAKLDRQIRDRAARTLNINSFHEHLPEPQNRVLPSADHKDALGIPQPEIYYSINDYVKKSAANTHQLYAQIASLFGGAEVSFDDSFSPNNHIMGTTIMGVDPADSVVDLDCRTHDHSNLFIASSAVMPTAASVNCTLTIAALSLKLADKLKHEA